MRKNRKKLVAEGLGIVLLAAALFSTACGGKMAGTTEVGTNSSEPIESQNKESSTGQNTDLTKPQMAELPKVEITHRHELRYSIDQQVALLEVNIDQVELSGAGYEKAAATVKDIFSKSDDSVIEMIQLAQSDYDCYKDNYDMWMFPYSIYSDCNVSRLDKRILSLHQSYYDYFGGAHGMHSESGITIDLETGEELALVDLAEDSDVLLKCCVEEIKKQLEERADELFESYEEYISENIQTTNWYMDASDIVFVYSPYEIGPYASSVIEARVPFDKLTEIMKPEYRPMDDLFICRVEPNVDLHYTVGDSSRSLRLDINEVNGVTQTSVVLDGRDTKLEEYLFYHDAYLFCKPDGEQFLLFTVDWASDDYETFVFDLSGKEAKQTDRLWAALDNVFMGSNTIRFRFQMDILGTYSTYRKYELTEKGELLSLEEKYRFGQYTGSTGLPTIKELPAEVDGSEVTLPVGTHIFLTETDNNGNLWFEYYDETGAKKQGLLRYVRNEEDYILRINGVSEYEYFENLPYAG